MIIPPRDPDNPGSIHRRTLIIIVLLVVVAGLAGYIRLSSDTDTVIRKRAEEVCGEGNVKAISPTGKIQCGTPVEEAGDE